MDSDEEFFASSATINFLLNCNRNEKGEFNVYIMTIENTQKGSFKPFHQL